MFIWYHSIAMGLFFPNIPNKVQTTYVWRHNDVIIVDFAQTTDLQWNIGRNWVFRQKNVPKIGISPGFLLIKEENEVSNIYAYCNIQDHTKKMFFLIVGTGANSPHDKGC